MFLFFLSSQIRSKSAQVVFNSLIFNHSKYPKCFETLFVRKPVTVLCSLRTSSPEENYSDSASEFSEDASSVDGLWQPDRLCRETDSMSEAESDARRLARRKLFVACAVSLVFMAGEVIGEMKKHRHNWFHLSQMYQSLWINFKQTAHGSFLNYPLFCLSVIWAARQWKVFLVCNVL